MLLVNMKLISVEGFVVSTTDYQEKSKIINIFTKEYGIIGCMSKGCKNLKSKLRLGSEKFAYATFHINYKEGKISTLIDADIIDYLINIKSDIKLISYISYLTELSSNVYKESNNEEVYDLYKNAVLKIENKLDPKIITNILELQYLKYLGIDLNLDECVCCGNTKVVTLSLSKGGYVCSKCRTNEIIVNEKIMKLLRLYYYVDIEKISCLDIDSEISNNISEILDEYYDEYSGVHPKSKKYLKKIEE